MKTKKNAKDPKDYQISGKFRVGGLVLVVKAPDQSVIIGPLVDKIGIIEKRLGREDGVFSTVNTYSVFLDVGTVHLHSLYMRLLSRVE